MGSRNFSLLFWAFAKVRISDGNLRAFLDISLCDEKVRVALTL